MQPEITKVVIEFEIFELKTCVLTLIWSWFFFQGEKSEGYLNLHKFVCVGGWVGVGLRYIPLDPHIVYIYNSCI